MRVNDMFGVLLLRLRIKTRDISQRVLSRVQMIRRILASQQGDLSRKHPLFRLDVHRSLSYSPISEFANVPGSVLSSNRTVRKYRKPDSLSISQIRRCSIPTNH
jgi:hypothetical protein